MLAVRPPHHRRPIAQPVLEDWERLLRHRADLDAVLLATGYTPRKPVGTGPAGQDDASGDLALAELVRRASVDSVAARVVLQRILPGLIAIARRRGGGQPGRTYEAFDELLATGWIVIRLFPIERRQRFVAANLLRDIEYQTFTRHRRRVMVRREIPCGGREPDAMDGASSFDEVVEVLSDGRAAGMALDDIRFASALASGITTAESAEERRVTHRAERYRRARVAAALRIATLGWGDDDAGC